MQSAKTDQTALIRGLTQVFADCTSPIVSFVIQSVMRLSENISVYVQKTN